MTHLLIIYRSTVFIISTIAGTGTGSYSGDGGPATSASLNYPSTIALDSSGTKFAPISIRLITYFLCRERVHR